MYSAPVRNGTTFLVMSFGSCHRLMASIFSPAFWHSRIVRFSVAISVVLWIRDGRKLITALVPVSTNACTKSALLPSVTPEKNIREAEAAMGRPTLASNLRTASLQVGAPSAAGDKVAPTRPVSPLVKVPAPSGPAAARPGPAAARPGPTGARPGPAGGGRAAAE